MLNIPVIANILFIIFVFFLFVHNENDLRLNHTHDTIIFSEIRSAVQSVASLCYAENYFIKSILSVNANLSSELDKLYLRAALLFDILTICAVPIILIELLLLRIMLND